MEFFWCSQRIDVKYLHSKKFKIPEKFISTDCSMALVLISFDFLTGCRDFNS